MITANTQRNGEDKVKGKDRRVPKLTVLIKRANGVPFVEGLRLAEEKGLVIASNARLDKALGSDEARIMRESSGVFWSGTMTAYKKPGKKLGRSVVYTDPYTKQRYVFPVPKDYRGAKDAILVVEHPNYTMEKDRKDFVVTVKNPENISLVEGFPSEAYDWYLVDEKHGIPTGNSSSCFHPDSRYLSRIDSRVGPVSVIYGHGHTTEAGVSINCEPSYDFGVVVEAPHVGTLD